MKNLAGHYGSSPANGGPWSAGPHFFFTPKHFCVLSLLDRRGVHAVSFNAMSWGVECVGDFDAELFTPDLANRYAEGLVCRPDERDSQDPAPHDLLQHYAPTGASSWHACGLDAQTRLGFRHSSSRLDRMNASRRHKPGVKSRRRPFQKRPGCGKLHM